MSKLALLAAAVCLIFCCGAHAEAQTCSPSVHASHYVGPSAEVTDGAGNGLVGMNALCQASFGATEHMCNVDEFFLGAAFANGGAGAPSMRIQPVAQECMAVPTENDTVYCSMVEFGVGQLSSLTQACQKPKNAGLILSIDPSWISGYASSMGLTVESMSLPPSPLGPAYAAGAVVAEQSCNTRQPVACRAH
jgi:hypothetical protein